MFVVNKKTEKIFEVYDIKNNKNGYPTFLIYDENQWKWVSAKHFKPVDIEVI